MQEPERGLFQEGLRELCFFWGGGGTVSLMYDDDGRSRYQQGRGVSNPELEVPLRREEAIGGYLRLRHQW